MRLSWQGAHLAFRKPWALIPSTLNPTLRKWRWKDQKFKVILCQFKVSLNYRGHVSKNQTGKKQRGLGISVKSACLAPGTRFNPSPQKKKKSNKQQKRTSRINNAISLLKDREPQRIVTIRTRGLIGYVNLSHRIHEKHSAEGTCECCGWWLRLVSGSSQTPVLLRVCSVTLGVSTSQSFPPFVRWDRTTGLSGWLEDHVPDASKW